MKQDFFRILLSRAFFRIVITPFSGTFFKTKVYFYRAVSERMKTYACLYTLVLEVLLCPFFSEGASYSQDLSFFFCRVTPWSSGKRCSVYKTARASSIPSDVVKTKMVSGINLFLFPTSLSSSPPRNQFLSFLFWARQDTTSSARYFCPWRPFVAGRTAVWDFPHLFPYGSICRRASQVSREADRLLKRPG